jgi:hypothetical protein
MPAIMISAIQQGFTDWLQSPVHRSRSPTYGSLHSPDILLTQAYYEQLISFRGISFPLAE